MSEGLWYREVFEDKSSFGLKVKRTLHTERSQFQQIEVFESTFLGRVLALDGILQTSEVDEHVYHEMIVHPAMCAAPRIDRVLVIGGGDGGTAREVLRHPGVKKCVMGRDRPPRGSRCAKSTCRSSAGACGTTRASTCASTTA